MLNRLNALVLLITGLALLYWGYGEYQGVGSQLSRALSGGITGKAATMLGLGALATVLGGVQTAKSFR